MMISVSTLVAIPTCAPIAIVESVVACTGFSSLSMCSPSSICNRGDQQNTSFGGVLCVVLVAPIVFSGLAMMKWTDLDCLNSSTGEKNNLLCS